MHIRKGLQEIEPGSEPSSPESDYQRQRKQGGRGKKEISNPDLITYRLSFV
ncbi:MAG: hypothetical protein AAGI07_11335 [Bacteroidota bacterium]